jgi:signal transduction histidine kinase
MSTMVPQVVVAHRLRRGELAALDLLAAVITAAACGYAAAEVTDPVSVAALVGVLFGLPVAVRRRWPLTASGYVVAASAVTLATGVIPAYASMSVAMALSFTLYTVAVLVDRRRSVVTMVAGVTVIMVALAVSTVGGGVDSPQNLAEIGVIAAVPVVAWLFGITVRERRAYAARAAEQVTLQAVNEERLRIARDLHDIVAHTMSLIAVKASVANHVAAERPLEARDALEAIEQTSRRALLDIRRTLGLLREEVSYEPAPGLADLPRLAEQVAAVGVDVDLTVEAGRGGARGRGVVGVPDSAGVLDERGNPRRAGPLPGSG